MVLKTTFFRLFLRATLDSNAVVLFGFSAEVVPIVLLLFPLSPRIIVPPKLPWRVVCDLKHRFDFSARRIPFKDPMGAKFLGVFPAIEGRC